MREQVREIGGCVVSEQVRTDPGAAPRDHRHKPDDPACRCARCVTARRRDQEAKRHG